MLNKMIDTNEKQIKKDKKAVKKGNMEKEEQK